MLRLFRVAGMLWVLFSLISSSGCSSAEEEEAAPKAVAAAFPGISLKVGAIDDAGILAGVVSQRGEWNSSRGGQITIREEPLSLETASEADVLIFPAQRLGDLADAELLEIIPNSAVIPPPRAETSDGDGLDDSQSSPEVSSSSGESSERPEDQFRYMDIAPVYRDQVVRYGTDRLALPLGGTALVLVYRGDAFKREANVLAARGLGITLEPPATWTKLTALARFFDGRDWDGDGKADRGIAFAMGADPEGVANSVFLARAASLAQHPDHFSMLFDTDKMAPRIAGPPFVEALLSLLELKTLGPNGMEKFDAAAAREAFRAGKVAMLIDRAERASTWSSGHAVSVARLPGSEKVFEPIRKSWETSAKPNNPTYLPQGGGWLVGVKRGLAGTTLKAAIDLAKYLANPENTNRLRAERTFPMLPVRTRQMSQGLPDPTSAPDVDVRLWSDAVRRTLLADRVVPGLRMPQAQGYLEDLTQGRLAAVAGEPVEKALEKVVELWNKRTEAFGPKRQAWNYKQTLNKLVTSSTPPPRGQ